MGRIREHIIVSSIAILLSKHALNQLSSVQLSSAPRSVEGGKRRWRDVGDSRARRAALELSRAETCAPALDRPVCVWRSLQFPDSSRAGWSQKWPQAQSWSELLALLTLELDITVEAWTNAGNLSELVLLVNCRIMWLIRVISISDAHF